MLSDVKDETLNCMISEKRVFIRHRAALCRTLFLGGFWWPHDPTYDMGPAQATVTWWGLLVLWQKTPFTSDGR